MSETFDLDIDREHAYFDDEWLSVGDLTNRISEMVAAGNYHVSRLSMAVEQLEGALAEVQTVMLKLTPAVIGAFDRLSSFESQPLSTTLRRALVHYLGSDEGAALLYRAHRAEEQSAGEA